MDRTIVIVLIVLLVVIALVFLCIGLFGKHYVCNKGECDYKYFELDGMTNSECNSMCTEPTNTQNEMVNNNVNNAKKYSCNEETGQCFQNENGLYNNQNNCQQDCSSKKIVKETRFVPVPYRDTVRIYERPRYFHNRLHPPPYPPYPPYPPPAPVPPAPVPPVGPEPVGPEPVGPEPVGPEPVGPEPVGPELPLTAPVPLLPIAPEPIAPEPIAPEPIAPEPLPLPPVESYCYFYN